MFQNPYYMQWVINENNFNIQNIKAESEYIDVFSSEWKKEINFESDFNYLLISNSPNIDITINTCWENTISKIFWIFYSSAALLTNAKLEVNLKNNNTKTEIYLLSITKENQKISVDGGINMAKWLKKLSWTLLEENLVFWNNVSIKTKPILNISSRDVQASHGARIQRIDADKMFYLSSKGISWPNAENLILDWHIDYVLSHFPSIDKDYIKSKIIQI